MSLPKTLSVIILFVLLSLLLVLQSKIWLSESGYKKFRDLSQQKDYLQSKKYAVLNNNKTIIENIKDLKNNNDKIEEKARYSYGYIADDEKFIEFN